jgi:outer membrane protein with beta-barrel domain
MRASLTALTFVLLTSGVAVAAEVERGFFDVYGGVMGLFESDVPGSKFADSSPTLGGRIGVWIGDSWGLTLRTWYFQTDAKLATSTSPSDLAFLGVSVEVVARWPLDDRWTVYGSLGPAMAVNTLDAQRSVDGRTIEEDSRSIAPGVSGAVGVEARLLPRLRAFAETQGSLVYPSFRFADRRLSPQLLNAYGLVGLRIPF